MRQNQTIAHHQPVPWLSPATALTTCHPRLSTPVLLISMTLYGEMSLQSVGVSCLNFVPSQLLVHPQPNPWWVRWETGKALILCEHCSAVMKISLCYSNSKHSPLQVTMRKFNSISAKTSTLDNASNSGRSSKSQILISVAPFQYSHFLPNGKHHTQTLITLLSEPGLWMIIS